MDASSSGPTISPDVLGASLATWYDITQSYVESSFKATGIHLVRWPGGSESDIYHWAPLPSIGTLCGASYIYPSSTFDALAKDVAQPANLDIAVTLDYGTNAACTGGGDPSEAATWVAYAKSQGYPVKYWTVGNEVFGSWETDMHPIKNDPTTYANAVKTGYYPKIKAADPNAKVGVVVEGSQSWDSIVLPKAAPYDFVEFHYYAQAPGQESDAYLIGQGIADFANALANLRSEMTADGVAANVPIYVGELNSVYSTPGKQTLSIVNGLFAGMAVAEMMKAGIPLSTWWLGYGGCTNGNDASSLYGWQDFGTYTLFSDGYPAEGCTSATIPAGTPFPTADAYALMSRFAGSGSAMRTITLANGVQNVRAYGDTLGSGYAFVVFNLSQSSSQVYTLGVAHQSRASFTATQLVYGKAQYDRSQTGVWTGPVTTSLGTVGNIFPVTLPPWSINLIVLQ